jgi:hypothetical protein
MATTGTEAAPVPTGVLHPGKRALQLVPMGLGRAPTARLGKSRATPARGTRHARRYTLVGDRTGCSAQPRCGARARVPCATGRCLPQLAPTTRRGVLWTTAAPARAPPHRECMLTGRTICGRRRGRAWRRPPRARAVPGAPSASRPPLGDRPTAACRPPRHGAQRRPPPADAEKYLLLSTPVTRRLTTPSPLPRSVLRGQPRARRPRSHASTPGAPRSRTPPPLHTPPPRCRHERRYGCQPSLRCPTPGPRRAPLLRCVPAPRALLLPSAARRAPR